MIQPRYNCARVSCVNLLVPLHRSHPHVEASYTVCHRAQLGRLCEHDLILLHVHVHVHVHVSPPANAVSSRLGGSKSSNSHQDIHQVASFTSHTRTYKSLSVSNWPSARRRRRRLKNPVLATPRAREREGQQPEATKPTHIASVYLHEDRRSATGTLTHLPIRTRFKRQRQLWSSTPSSS
jgi:hypothetical protein